VKGTALEHAIEALEGKDLLVSYSGGKDSTIILDLSRRVGKRVECFFMELVPGLKVIDDRLAWAEARFNVKIRRYPHWLRAKFAREGVYCFHAALAVQVDIADIHTVAREDAGINLIVSGAKKADSLWQRRAGPMKFASDTHKAPLWDWSHRDVMGYLRSRDLPVPATDGRRDTGIDLTEECVTWLYNDYPEDFTRLEAVYPFCGALVERVRLYGDRDTRQRAAKAAARGEAGESAEAGED